MTEPASSEFRPDRYEFLTLLGLAPPVSEEDVKQAYLDKCKTAHPDHGGDVDDFKRLQAAFEEATEYARFKASRMQWLSRWVEQYAEQEQIIEQVKALGGSVEVKASEPLSRSLGADFATVLDKVIGIQLSGPKVNDAVVAKLAAQRRLLAGLRRLALVDTSVSHVGILQLRTFESLRHVDLTGTQVDLAAVEALLKELPELESIELDKTGIGWPAKMKLKLMHRQVQFL